MPSGRHLRIVALLFLYKDGPFKSEDLQNKEKTTIRLFNIYGGHSYTDEIAFQGNIETTLSNLTNFNSTCFI